MKTPLGKIAKSRLKSLNKRLFNKHHKRLDVFIKHAKLKGVNGNNQNDRLEKLKAKYEQEIQGKERELQELRAKLSALKMFERAAEILEDPESKPDKYTNKGMTDSILDTLENWPTVA